MITNVQNIHLDLMKAWRKIQENESHLLDNEEELHRMPSIHQTLCQGLISTKQEYREEIEELTEIKAKPPKETQQAVRIQENDDSTGLKVSTKVAPKRTDTAETPQGTETRAMRNVRKIQRRGFFKFK